MHARSRPGGSDDASQPAAEALLGVPGAPTPAAAAPVSVFLLQPFRAHTPTSVAELEFCTASFAKATRHRKAEWHAGCCDGTSPIRKCPKHIQATIAVANRGRSAMGPRNVFGTSGRDLEDGADLQVAKSAQTVRACTAGGPRQMGDPSRGEGRGREGCSLGILLCRALGRPCYV